MKTKISISISLTAFLLCAILTTAFADIAPPLQPPGANPAPLEYEKTYVEMGYETVNIYVGEASNLYYLETHTDTVNARVNAMFIMSNRGETDETLLVLFPLNNTDGWGDGLFSQPEVQNLSIKVDSQPVAWVEKTTTYPTNPEKMETRWAEFEVKFPLEEVVWIDISYDLQSTGYFPEATFSYILETGGGWYGPIGEAHIFLNLPYEASDENVLAGDRTSPNGLFEDNKVHWEYTNLEPDTGDNWAATIIAPHIWEQILNLRESISQGDGHAYAKITRLYDALIMNRSVREGTEELIFLNYDAYKEALDFDPQNDNILARFADFKLFLHENGRDTPETPAGLEDIYNLASRALEINPLNDTAYQVLNWLENTLDFTPPVPTAAAEQPTESGNKAAESDDAASVEDQPNDLNQAGESQNNTLLYLLGAGLLAALGVIITLVYKLGKKNAS